MVLIAVAILAFIALVPLVSFLALVALIERVAHVPADILEGDDGFDLVLLHNRQVAHAELTAGAGVAGTAGGERRGRRALVLPHASGQTLQLVPGSSGGRGATRVPLLFSALCAPHVGLDAADATCVGKVSAN